MTIGYDGTEFHGWQRQPDRRTVQGELERALERVLERTVTIAGAGRTDAGVHARGQVASFDAETDLPARALPPLLARELPEDVTVVDAVEAPAGFHARHDARARHYRYRLLDRDDVLWRRHAWWPRHALGLEPLMKACEPLAGTHDCSAFRAVGSSPSEPICRIERAEWSRWEGGYAFDVEADHFLYHMVRNLVGTALDAARTDDPAAHVRGVLAARDRANAGVTAPPHGLCLESVRYEVAA